MADASSVILAESDADTNVGAFGSSSTTKGAAGESARAGTPESVVRELQAYREAQMEAVKANLFLGGERPRSAVFADDDTHVRDAKVDDASAADRSSVTRVVQSDAGDDARAAHHEEVLDIRPPHLTEADATPVITANPLSTDSSHVAAAATAMAAGTSSTPDRAAGVTTEEDVELAAGPQLELTIRRKATEIEFDIEENSENTIEFNGNIASTDAGSAATSGGGRAVFSTEAVDAAPQKRRRSSVTGRVIDPQKTVNRTRAASRGVRQSIKDAMAGGKTLDRTCIWSGATEKVDTHDSRLLACKGALANKLTYALTTFTASRAAITDSNLPPHTLLHPLVFPGDPLVTLLATLQI